MLLLFTSSIHVLLNPLIILSLSGWRSFSSFPSTSIYNLLNSLVRASKQANKHMKLSLKFRGNDDDGDHHHNSSTQTQIMTAKVPITVFNYPLMSIITSTTTNTNKSTSSDFTFSLSTNFPTGPTLRLSYSPSLTSSLPFSLSLKSGLSLFGSPRNSPLIFSANFPLSLSTTTTHTPPPSFFLHFKPQFGHFSLNKTVFSDNNNNNNNNNNALPLSLPLDNPQIDKGFVASPYGSSSGWQNLNLEPYTTKESNNDGVVMTETENNPKRGLSPGLAIMARTVVPVTQGLLLNFRWGVNFLGKSGFQIPYLTVNKIGLERVEEVKQKGMLLGMTKELESVEKENREIKRVLNEMKKGVSNSNSNSKSSTTTTTPTHEGKKRSDNEKVGNKQKNSFQHWENNNGNNEKNTVKQPNQNKPPPVVVGSDLESELQKAIKAAASNSY